MKHNFWRGVICGLVLALVGKAAIADTISITPSLFSISLNGIVQSTNAEFVDEGDATYGGRRAQGVFTLDGRWVYWSAIEGIPCDCRPGWQWDAYYLDNFEPLGWIAGQNAQVLYTQVGEFLILDGQPIRTHPGDWNGDGTTSVQDIFDFLTDSVAGTTSISVADFLADYFAPPPSLTICPCTMDDYPFSIHPQGMADDECYEHYKRKGMSAWQEFLLRAEDCRLPNSICYDCSCLFNRYLEFLALANDYWRECGE